MCRNYFVFESASANLDEWGRTNQIWITHELNLDHNTIAWWTISVFNLFKPRPQVSHGLDWVLSHRFILICATWIGITIGSFFAGDCWARILIPSTLVISRCFPFAKVIIKCQPTAHGNGKTDCCDDFEFSKYCDDRHTRICSWCLYNHFKLRSTIFLDLTVSVMRWRL